MPGRPKLTNRRGLCHDTTGTVLVEFVAVLPLMVIILLMVIALGQGLWFHQVITKGVRDGVRYLSRTPVTADFINSAKNVAITGTPDGGDPAFSFWSDPDSVQVTLTPVAHTGEFRTPSPLTTIRMTASVPIVIPVLDYFGLDPQLTLTVSDQIRHIGE